MAYKIAVVLDFWDYSLNGTGISTQRFIEQLEKKGYAFVILATGKTAPEKVVFKPFSLPIIKQILEKMHTPLALPDDELIRQTLKDCDLVHVQIPFFLGARVIKIANEMGVPVITSFHVQPENILKNLRIRPKFLIKWLYKIFNKHFFSRSSHVICPSIFARKMLSAHNIDANISVVSNGIPNHFLYAPKKERYLPKDKYHILSVGRLAFEKHQDLIIRALANSSYADKITLSLVGSGPADDYIRGQANKYLPGKVTIERVSDEELIRLYRTADLFIHAGEIELEGMSVMEAMASGLPVIVSDSKDSAAKDFAKNPLSLFHFPDQDDLTHKIEFWLSNPKTRADVSSLNYQTALQYSHAASCRRIENIYRKLLNLDPLPVGPNENADEVVVPLMTQSPVVKS
ncbi:MAG: glycosyltransferase [Cellvibrionales bacterium]|nr:glycosyltransferase [Cellvibrionales bacterium]